jgi:RecA/RadA recombinase
MIDIYKKIVIADKGSTKKGTVNNPLSDYLIDEHQVKEFLSTDIITLNLAFSGKVDGGILKNGITMFSSPSKFGKTLVSLSLARKAQKRGMTVILIDSEYAFDWAVAKAFGVDISKDKFIPFQEDSLEEIMNIIAKISDEMPEEDRKKVL